VMDAKSVNCADAPTDMNMIVMVRKCLMARGVLFYDYARIRKTITISF
jgi:hypothetical protein